MGKSHRKKKLATGGVTRIKAACGHRVSYPSPWNQFVKRGHGYIVLQSCPCGYGHVIVIRESGTDVLTTDNAAKALKLVYSLPFQKQFWSDEFGRLLYQRFNQNDTGIIDDFIDRFPEIPSPNTENEKTVADMLREFYAGLLN